MKKLSLILLLVSCIVMSANAQNIFGSKKVKTINVTPDNAKIYMGGVEVGSGIYELTIGKSDFVILKLSAPGYREKIVRVNKADKKNAYNFTLEEDDSWIASDANSDIANKSMKIIVTNKNMTADEVWKRLNLTISDAFEDFEKSDKAVGIIRTAWSIQSFNYVTIRTRLEVKEVPGMDQLTYKVTLQSEIADRNCGLDDQCFAKWDRILKKFNNCIPDLQDNFK